MKTALPFFLFFLLGCMRLDAGTGTPDSYTYCLECGIPQNLSVQNLTTTSATLVWNAVAGATKYNIEVENTQNSSGAFHADTTVSGTSFQLGGLQAGKTYKFKVRARCGGDHGDWADWQFFNTSDSTSMPGDTTGTANCAPPTLLSSTVNGTSATLSWNAIGTATQYYLEVEDEQNQPSNFHLEVQVSGTSYQLSPILPNVLYKFKVSTQCDSSSHGPWSEWQFFNTSDSTSMPGDTTGTANCAPPTLLSSTVNGTSATLSWNAVGTATQYYLEVEDEQNQPSNFHLEVQVSGTSYQLSPILPNVLYKFKVSTQCDSSSHGPWSGWQFFNGNSDSTNTGGNNGGSCGKPIGLHLTGITENAADLHWFAVPGALSYTLEIERFQNSTSNPWQITQVVSTNSFHLTGLNSNTRYKFKVRANCSGGHSDWSNWRKFKTAHAFLTPMFNPSPALEERDGSPSAGAPAFDLQVWPNPVKTNATVRLSQLKPGSVSLRVTDLSGRTVQDRQFRQDGTELNETFSFQDLPEGCYLLQVRNGSDVKSAKLVVIH